MSIITLDYIDNIVLDTNNPPMNNLHALNYLPQGLYSLAATVRIEEGKRVQRDGAAKTMEMFGHIPFIIPCAFHWFSTSLVNFVRLIGLIDLMHKNNWKSDDLANSNNKTIIKTHCTEYVKKIIPEIHIWRNKVSAHFAPTDPYANDNLGTLEEAVMLSIVYMTPYFKVGAMKWTTQGESSQLPSWALTETYEKLSDRYWPKSKIYYDSASCRAPEPFSFV